MNDYTDLIADALQWHPASKPPKLTNQVEGDDFLLDFSDDVAVLCGAAHIRKIGRYVYDMREYKWTDDAFDEISGVTHWMPLPKPPKENEND